MAKMKEFYMNQMESVLCSVSADTALWHLSKQTGYPKEYLWYMLFEFLKEALDDGEPIEGVWPDFYSTAMEHDF